MERESYSVIVVDDDPIYLRAAKRILGNEDIRVSAVRSGQDMLKLLEKTEPDLILLDILMPDMDGFETYRVLQEFEASEGRPSTPVIFLTGESDTDTERRGLKAGASDFIRKPFDKDVLVKRIKNTIENSRKIESLTEEATVDKLTGFLNKASGTETISKRCAECGGALLIFDLDSFKLVNDLFGHDMGDRVLVSFANIIRKNIRDEDVVSRIGGDEFMAFFMGVSEEGVVAALCERLNSELRKETEKLMGENHDIPFGVSIGAAFTPEHGKAYKLLFQYADSALFKVKQAGKHGYDVYSPTLISEQKDVENLDEELDRVTQIVEERGDVKQAMILGQEAFSWNYRYIVRFVERYQETAVRILFYVSIREEGPMYLEIAAEFGAVLQKTLRRSDIIWQCKPDQFFTVLPQMSETNAQNLLRRIMHAWKKTGYHERAEIKYSLSVIDGEEASATP